MPNQSNSPQTTEPTEPTQDTGNSNSPSEEVSKVPLRQSSSIRNRPKYLQDYLWPKGWIKDNIFENNCSNTLIPYSCSWKKLEKSCKSCQWKAGSRAG